MKLLFSSPGGGLTLPCRVLGEDESRRGGTWTVGAARPAAAAPGHRADLGLRFVMSRGIK